MAWSVVDLAARNRETVLSNMYLNAQNAPPTVKKIVNMLLDSGVEVHQARSQVVADGRFYGLGSFVVTMAQPKQGLIRWMLGRTFYPDNTYTATSKGIRSSRNRTTPCPRLEVW